MLAPIDLVGYDSALLMMSWEVPLFGERTWSMSRERCKYRRPHFFLRFLAMAFELRVLKKPFNSTFVW